MDPSFIHKVYINKYSYEEIKVIYDKEKIHKKGKRIKSIFLPDGSRYRLTDTFRLVMEKGNTCRSCSRKGTYFLEIPKNSSKFDNNACIYLFNDSGELMTGDHIIPRSIGGSDRMLNMQPMCNKCNWKKDNTVPEVDIVSLYSFRQILEIVLKVFPKGTEKGEKFYDEYKSVMKYRFLKNLPPFMNKDEVEICLFVIKEEYGINIKLDDLRVKLAPKITTN